MCKTFLGCYISDQLSGELRIMLDRHYALSETWTRGTLVKVIFVTATFAFGFEVPPMIHETRCG